MMEYLLLFAATVGLVVFLWHLMDPREGGLDRLGLRTLFQRLAETVTQ